jgi:transcriptional regulator with XRE-family HTH domain
MQPASSLELARRMRGYTQDALARLVTERGVPLYQYKLSQLERGLHPSPEERRAICEVLKLSELYVFPYEDYGAPSHILKASQAEG